MDQDMQAALAFCRSRTGPFVDGAFLAGEAGSWAVENPASREVLAHVGGSGPRDVDRAVSSAKRAFDAWRREDPAKVAAGLFRLADLVERDGQVLSALESLSCGKPIREARADVQGSAAVLRYYAGWATKLCGETNPTESRFLSFTEREPVGVCGLIVPWNFPLLMVVWKLAPALACGNTAVLKPAPQTPLTALYLAGLCLEAGLPPGAVNVVPGDSAAGEALVTHASVDKIAFTGSTAVGRQIAAKASQGLKRLHLELGGKNANIIFSDADIDKAIAGSFEGAFENGGQACTAVSLLLVHRSLADRVTGAFKERCEAIRVGPGIEEETQLGALVSQAQLDRVQGYVRGALDEGARLVTGRAMPELPGYFMAPTLLSHVTPEMRAAREEIFGPVVTVISFEDEEEAISIANGTPYGLAAAVWTRDIKRAHRAARRLRCGTVWINTCSKIRPAVSFGGVKLSGFGRDLGRHALDHYTELKSVFVDLGA